MEGEVKIMQPRPSETIIVNATGEKRIVPKSFLKNKRVMNTFGWREDRQPQVSRPPMSAETNATEFAQDDDAFQDITKPKGPGRPKNTK